MQQSETQLIYWSPSRVRFNLTLILAAAVILFGLYQYFFTGGGDEVPAEGTAQTAEGETADSQQTRGRSNNAWLLIIVGLGVGGYSWLTGPRQYRVYSDALVIMYGMPRSRQIHFSQIREAVNDRGFMGDPLRVYTSNRRRIAIQVREPEEFHRYLQGALDEYWRAYPEHAPPPREEDEAGSGGSGSSSGSGEMARPADVVESAAADPPDAPAPPFTPEADADAAAPDDDAPTRRTRRRSLRDDSGSSSGNGGSSDGGYDSNTDDSRPRFS